MIYRIRHVLQLLINLLILLILLILSKVQREEPFTFHR